MRYCDPNYRPNSRHSEGHLDPLYKLLLEFCKAMEGKGYYSLPWYRDTTGPRPKAREQSSLVAPNIIINVAKVLVSHTTKYQIKFDGKIKRHLLSPGPEMMQKYYFFQASQKATN